MNYFSLGELVMDLAPEAERKNLRNSEGAFFTPRKWGFDLYLQPFP